MLIASATILQLKSVRLKCFGTMFLTWLTAWALGQELPFKHFTVESGLSHNTVNAIRQDSLGFLWVGTANGLNRFNGYEFDIFEASEDVDAGLRSNHINTLEVDGNTIIWIGTRKGLSYWDHRKGAVVCADTFFPNLSMDQYNVGDILIDPDGGVWVLAEYEGFHVFYKEKSATQFVEKLYLPDPPVVTEGFYGELAMDERGQIYVGTSRAGFWILDKHSKPRELTVDPGKTCAISCVLIDHEGSMWLGTLSGLLRRKAGEKSFRFMTSLSDSTIRSLYEDGAGRIWVGTDTGGLNLYIKERDTFVAYDHQLEDPRTLLHNSVKSIFEDRQGILWVGTYAGGLSQHDPNLAAFEHFHSGITNRFLNNNSVTAFAEDNAGNYWVATDRGGLNYYDRKTKTFAYYRHSPKPGSVSSDIIQHICMTSDGDLWVGNWATGLDVSAGRNQFVNINRQGGGLANSVQYIFEDRQRNVWIATKSALHMVRHRDIGRLKAGEAVLESWQNNPGDSTSLSDNFVKHIFEDHNGVLWVATWSGLNRFDPATGTFMNHRNNPEGLKLFTDDFVLCVAETSKGDLLIGTNERGLLYYKTKEDRLLRFNKSNGFPSSTIQGLQQDANGLWWISTTNGLVRFDAETFSLNVYNQFDGLPSNEFRSNACYTTTTGHMLFGGNNGFVLFHPDAIRTNVTPPKVAITEFRIFNEPVRPAPNGILENDISLTSAVELAHDQSSLLFEFVALNFTAAAKNRYAYQLEGIDRGWNDAGTQRSASYAYIPPGEYTFRVRASNNDGVWSDPVSILVVVHPAWWQTTWFRLLTVTFLAALGVFLYKRRTHQLHEKRRLLEEMVRKRTQELEDKNVLLSERQEEIVQQKEQLEEQRDHLEQQNQTIRMLSEIGQQITSSIRKDELILQLYMILRKLITVDHFSIGHLDKDKQAIEFSSVTGEDATIREAVVPLAAQSFAARCVSTRQSICLDNIPEQFRSFFDDSDRYPDGYCSAMYLPLQTIDQGITGVLVVKSRRVNAYSEVNLNTLRSLAAYISIAFENATIYKEIEAQSELLQAQSEKLDRLDKLKTNFFINLSHEFRTPLTLIISPLENILANAAQITPDDWTRLQRQLAIMHKNARQLLGLINELLEVRKLEVSGQINMSLSRADMVGFVRMIVDNYEDLIAQLKLTVTVNAAEPVLEMWFDAQIMQKVFTNLITNAIKYTPEHGCIDIKLERQSGDKEHVAITIRDTGVGISPEELPYVFERFYQGGQPLNHIQSGSGIGLGFIRDLVRLHQGTIDVRSETGKGTVFSIVLPTRNEEEIHAAEQVSEAPVAEAPEFVTGDTVISESNGAATVLVVEDNVEVANFLREELANEFRVVLAANGREGLDQCLQTMPDIVLSDVMMPVMDGMELCKSLKDDFRTSHIPVIMLTAKSGEESFIKGLNLGADDYVAKPFNLNILRARIHNLINSRKKLHELFSSREKIVSKEVIENSRDRSFIEKLDACIERNLANPELNHEILGTALGMSKTQLYRKLQTITGKSVHEYIRNYRLRVAHQLMRTRPDFRVFEIAYEVGFKDAAYFSKSFYAFFNFWPADLKVVQ